MIEFSLGTEKAPNLYLNRDPKNYIRDGEPRALYWHPYRETFEQLKNVLEKGQPIPDSLPIMLIGNNKLSPFHFDIRKKDRSPIGNFSIPGISAHIAFTQNPHVACGALFDRDCRRQDHLYVIPQAGLIAPINYQAIYLPTPNQPLHARIVHLKHQEDPDLHLPPFNDRERLAQLFSQYKI